MYRIGICDDNAEVVNEVERYLNDIQQTEEYKLDIHSFTEAKEFLEDLEQDLKLDVVFLDIELGTCNGIDIAKTIAETKPEIMIIFITAFHQYIHESFQVRPIGYLEKPITREMVGSTLAKALKALDDMPVLNYSFQGCQYRILLKKIAYLESRGRKIILGKASGGAEETFYGKLDEMEKQINDKSDSFCRISQSVMVNLRYIRAISYTSVTVDVNGMQREFGISRRYKDAVREKYMEYMRR